MTRLVLASVQTNQTNVQEIKFTMRRHAAVVALVVQEIAELTKDSTLKHANVNA